LPSMSSPFSLGTTVGANTLQHIFSGAQGVSSGTSMQSIGSSPADQITAHRFNQFNPPLV
jgi:hypothetical protein